VKKENNSNQNGQPVPNNTEDTITTLSGMYEEYFLDYASYVILERAVPYIEDGLKPVQRRILHSMKTMDDGRFHKVANIIGQTMQYHPHGDAAIGGALVHIGQKDLMIDCQGNWGDINTGDNAAAPRYIEARLSKFALAVAFNPQTTDWQMSYDGRKREPITLPVKFPLLLKQGVEGIAVGLSTKIMPHNFIELVKASIAILNDKRPKIYPDFLTGGIIDVSNYNRGQRGGKIRVRARLEIADKKTLVIHELPYGVTATAMKESIVKAHEKGKIKIKQVIDNTAKNVELRVLLPPGVSPEVTMDALYAFTSCEISISPNACVVIDNKPHFMGVDEILRINTQNTKDLLQQELEIKLAELLEKWHFSSLEKIFIENRVYREIEECETWEEVIETIDRELKKYVSTPTFPSKRKGIYKLMRDVTEEDITKLTEIKIKRISKYNKFKADELMADLKKQMEEVRHHLAHLTEYAIAYYNDLLKRFGKGRKRRTEIAEFDTIRVRQVVANNSKLYVNYKEGFIGFGMKKDEFVCDCSDIDDVIVFLKDGKFRVTRIADKVFVGKDIVHVAIWKKGDTRTTYNAAYLDGASGKTYAKRFNVKAITRDKDYFVTKGTPRSKVLYFTVNPNGESEIVTVQLSQGSTARKKIFDFDYADIDIKGRGSQGNMLSKYPVRKITQKKVGKSTIGAQKIWVDKISGRINIAERGDFLGAFDTGDQILAIYKNGTYEITNYELTNRYDPASLVHIVRHEVGMVISSLYYDADKKASYVKRFEIETTSQGQKFSFIGENSRSQLLFATTDVAPKISYKYRADKTSKEADLDLSKFIDVKGWKAQGNKLGEYKPMAIKALQSETSAEVQKEKKNPPSDSLGLGTQIEFDL